MDCQGHYNSNDDKTRKWDGETFWGLLYMFIFYFISTRYKNC
jgi:hypothetical protein